MLNTLRIAAVLLHSVLIYNPASLDTTSLDYSSPLPSPAGGVFTSSRSSDVSTQPGPGVEKTASAVNEIWVSEIDEEVIVMGRLVPRAEVTKIRRVNVSMCQWNSVIEGTYTKPIWLVAGISLGAIAGMVVSDSTRKSAARLIRYMQLFAWALYYVGKVGKGGPGGAAMGGGMAPPPAL